MSFKLEYQVRAFAPDDLPAIQIIRKKAFQPIYEGAFRSVLGDEIFHLEYSTWDKEQGDYLQSICAPDSDKEVFVMTLDDKIIGFIGISMNHQNGKGEIDLNAIDPDHQGHGAGAAMYQFAVARMKKAGMRLVKVSTGGDPSHAPARKAYEKAGFNAAFPSVHMFQVL